MVGNSAAQRTCGVPLSFSHSGSPLISALLHSLSSPVLCSPLEDCKVNSRYVSFLGIIFNQNVMFQFNFRWVCLNLFFLQLACFSQLSLLSLYI